MFRGARDVHRDDSRTRWRRERDLDDTPDRGLERRERTTASRRLVRADHRRETEGESGLEGEPSARQRVGSREGRANTTLICPGRLHGGKKTAFKSSFKVKTGKWTHTLKLPPSLAPGKYDVTVTGSGVRSSQTSFTLLAPKSGIVKRDYATGPRRGPEVTTLSGTSELWATSSSGRSEEGPDDHDPVDPPERQQTRGQHAPAHEPRRSAGQGSLRQGAARRTWRW